MVNTKNHLYFMMDLRTGEWRQVLGSLEQQLEELRLESMAQSIIENF